MKFGYTIVYVSSVEDSLAFYKRAFGLEKMLHESRQYGELDTGDTVLAFAPYELGDANIGGKYLGAAGDKPLGVELVFATEDVQAAFAGAVSAGAEVLKAPTVKPWGQTVGYVKTPDNSLIELCTPV